MIIDDKIRDERPQYNINREYEHYHQVKLMNTNILQMKKYCYLIKVK